jgi:uncharacterized protein (DUF1684 family)
MDDPHGGKSMRRSAAHDNIYRVANLKGNKMEFSAAHQRWQAARQDELAGPNSWLGLIALIWLEAGDNTVGSAAECAVKLPAGPERLGILRVDGVDLAWQAVADAGAIVEESGAWVDGWQILHSDRNGTPSRIGSGSLSFFVIEREGRLAVRLRDRDWAMHRPAPELCYFDYAPAWRIEADWQPLLPPLNMEVPNVSGELKTVAVTHQAVFQVDGQRVALLPMSVGEQEIFFVLRDRTSGRESYGGGRFLKVSAAVNGKISLDFNFAYNPPCAFTPFATCPLPPPENWLPFAVEAGEKKPAGH